MHLTFSKHTRNSCTHVYTKHRFFEDYFIYEVKQDCVIFKHVTIDYQGKVLKMSKEADLYTGAVAAKIPYGNYEPSDESNEDQLIIYYTTNSIKCDCGYMADKNGICTGCGLSKQE